MESPEASVATNDDDVNALSSLIPEKLLISNDAAAAVNVTAPDVSGAGATTTTRKKKNRKKKNKNNKSSNSLLTTSTAEKKEVATHTSPSSTIELSDPQKSESVTLTPKSLSVLASTIANISKHAPLSPLNAGANVKTTATTATAATTTKQMKIKKNRCTAATTTATAAKTTTSAASVTGIKDEAIGGGASNVGINPKTNNSLDYLHSITSADVQQHVHEVLDNVHKLDGFCDYKLCKSRTALIGDTCTVCKHRFCFKHYLPEVHGCGEGIKKLERTNFLHPTPMKSKPIGDLSKRKQDELKKAQKRLDKKLKEMSTARKKNAPF